jgi:hypothetical protein
VQAAIIIACQYYSATNLVVAQEAQVENPCLICPSGATLGLDDYVPDQSYRDPITCKEIIISAKLFETGGLWCAQYEELAGMYCCPTTPDDPCALCPNGITVADDYEPYNNGGYTCSYWLDYYYADFDAMSDTCTIGRSASEIESHCCPSTEANNPCTICPDGATVGDDFVPYDRWTSRYNSDFNNEDRTCKDIIKANLNFEAESEMCLVHAKEDEYYCCPSSTTEFDDYCNICPSGITAGDDFSPWSHSFTCKQLVQNAKIYENGSVGCNYHKGYELSCCPGTGTADAESTPSSPPISTSSETSYAPTGIPETGTGTGLENTLPETHTKQLYIVGFTAAIVGAVAALVAAAFAFARWKNKNITSTIPSGSTLPNIVTSSVPMVTATVVPQSTNVYNTPMLSQRNISLVN